ncbi:hypothetical protein JD844_015074 [Phrynosoma platyrhinos]|uniref:Uncharacterized protein n=1 Tax=Phrynosoma platyrhinos TaxID=52577 RepID=A0ABQ7T7F0_PHRPL|nr:hypothetical protein JD844_015074 [Phrynosoma platyrhinos]
MAQSGRTKWPHGSRNTYKRNQDPQSPKWVKTGPQTGAKMADGDRERDPDCANNSSGEESSDREISTASVISDCSLRKPNPRTQKEYVDCRHGHPNGPGGNHLDNRGLDGHPTPRFSIERSSLLTNKAAEKLEDFLSKELGARGENHAACRYENTDGHRRHHRRDHADPKGMSRRPTCVQSSSRIGDMVESPLGVRQDLSPWHLWQNLGGKRQGSEGFLWKREGSGHSTAVSGSTRILPRCQINHVQHCQACQAYNRDQPSVPYENCWSPLSEEDHAGGADRQDKQPEAPSSRQQVSDRLSKVQRWLEQTSAEPDPLNMRVQPPAVPGTPGWCHACASTNQKDEDLWGREGVVRDCWRSGTAAEMRPRQTRHLGENHHHHRQPSMWILPCDDTSTSPSTCNCPFCERQRPRAQLVSSNVQPDLSANEVARRLQAENRIAQIVEAFERRTLREAKRTEKRGGRVTTVVSEAKRGQRSRSTAKAHKSHPTEKERH